MKKEKIKKPFYKKWWVWLIAVIIVIGIAIGGTEDPVAESGSTPASTDTQNNQNDSSDNNDSSDDGEDTNEEGATEEPSGQTFTNGTYLVGEDIEAGLYRAVATGFAGMAYVERASDVSMEFDDIIANIVLTGDGYVEILEGDVAVKIQGAELTKVVYEELEKNIQAEVEDGIYLVGIDIEPGQYKVEVTDTVTGMAYVERASRVSMGFEDIIANEIFEGQGYVNVSESDFAVKVQGAKLIKN
ncbi:hypothetical protein [Sutcliffiella rhizosphaerae]|uniref:Uncharacterized protein n=1 Tax=Sutcliffiella rhizosphaerae TaxID=2880967 RepID=A0ABM8YML6_9BACI|nr:hypothetical protein [Sutcliffiella rhizosphaerae]CAG9621055.1 hypothetical protein BACCIP111883_01827 [Sutcliffiella rhizosphaerae]